MRHRPFRLSLIGPTGQPGLDQSRAYELADAARQTLADQTVTLRDYETVGDPIVGSATLSHAGVEDHTRRDVDTGWHRLTHLVVTVPAVARKNREKDE